jgi:hypothetical protein
LKRDEKGCEHQVEQMNRREEEVAKILSDLVSQGILPQRCEYAPLSGGTISDVGVIVCAGERKYVFKAGEPAVLAAEVRYLLKYRGISLLPALHHVDAEFHFLVMEYVAGETNNPVSNKKALLTALVQQVINHYEPVSDTDQWGWVDAPQASWRSFLIQEVLIERRTIGDHLSEEEHQFILDIAESKSATTPYLLHGDFGVHNFLFDEEKLVGVIDPFPVIGEPIYDLVYAFCSTPDDLNMDTIAPAVALLHTWQPTDATQLYHEILLGLYLRLSKCLRHHPSDLPRYLAAWKQWNSELKVA